MRRLDRSDRAFLLLWALLVATIFYLWRIDTSHAAGAPVRGRPAAEQTIQIKLRDLLDAIPRKEAAEIAARLKAIEERLAAIEGLLKAPPVPTPVPLQVPR